MTVHRLAAAALAAVLGLSALLPAGARHHEAYSVTERVTMTYYLPTGSVTATGTLPTEGRTVGCLRAYLGAIATMPNGDQYVCEDTGLVYTPWVDFFSWSDADGWDLVYTHATDCPSMCYSTVVFSWPQ